MPTFYNKADAIEGERIVCQFRKSGREEIIRGTGAHRSKKLTLYNAHCFIARPYRFEE